MAAEAAFRARLAELGAVLLEPQWLGRHAPHRVRCAAGHDCGPRPSGVLSGQGPCLICGGRDSAAAEAAFRARLAELGSVLLEPQWLGRHAPHRVRCAAGHDCTPTPGNTARQGICQTCAHNDPAAAEAAFRARLAELGATLLEPQWLGVDQPHRVRCAVDHLCTPRPHGVLAGLGICWVCRGHVSDVFYVVVNDQTHRVKFGITSGDPRPRLGDHARAGYRRVVLLRTGLLPGSAHELERAARAALWLAGERPAAGREYFDVSALAVVLDIAGELIGGAA